jgi:hypothetical protein
VLPRPVAAPVPLAAGPADAPPAPRPWYRRWYVWTLIGVVLAGGAATGAVLGSRAAGNNVPRSTYGFNEYFGTP